jgi:S-adenosylmethionine decarboxylase
MEHFGEHVTIDGYGGDMELLNSESGVTNLINGLVSKLGMHGLIEPVVVNAPDNGIKDPGGWSGFIIIAESHIAIHTFPKRGFVSADVYTCQNGLGTQTVIDTFKEAFKLKDVETNFIKRGTRYPLKNIY